MGERIDAIMKNIEFPNEKLFEELVEQFDNEQLYKEAVVRNVFNTFDNSSIENVLTKIIILNNIYSAGLTTNMLGKEKSEMYNAKGKALPVDVTTMAKHIYNTFKGITGINDDSNVIALVDKIRNVGDNYQDAYSFATKYCSWTFGEIINVPIVDSYVKGLLYRLNKKNPFTDSFTQNDLNFYHEYCRIYKAFVEKAGLSNESYKNIDKYLWQYAKNLLVNNNIDIRI